MRGSLREISLVGSEMLICYFVTSLFRPENVPRLFDLIKPKEDKFLTAFYFALRDTLVAKDLDQATRIGLQVSSW